jgi:hypothetical protein
MDLYTIAFICFVSSVVSMLVTTVMLWRDDRLDARAREAREALAAANKEVSRRPRMPAPSPVPLSKGSQ